MVGGAAELRHRAPPRLVLVMRDVNPLRRRALIEKAPFAGVRAVGARVALAALRATADRDVLSFPGRRPYAWAMGTALRALFLVVLVILPEAGHALAAGERPTEADLAACAEFAREQPAAQMYTERAPTSPFPSRASKVSPWTGPVAGTRPPLPVARPPAVGEGPLPGATGVFGAGGGSQEAMSEPGAMDVRFKEAFDACMRARGF